MRALILTEHGNKNEPKEITPLGVKGTKQNQNSPKETTYYSSSAKEVGNLTERRTNIPTDRRT